MRDLRLAFGLATLAVFQTSLPACAQVRTVAITVDDLPYQSGTLNASDAPAAETANRELLAAFRAHRVPVTGFVIEKSVEALGSDIGKRILKEWIGEGFDLGNHTYSHADTNGLSLDQIEEEIVRGEATIGPLMKQVGKKPEFFRFPYNHTGDTQQKQDTITAFLSGRGYRLATCTIDNSDWQFNRAYVRMLANHDNRAARRARREYLSYTGAEIDYYAALNRQVFGYEPPEVMLLHDNRLNADVIEKLLALFEKRRYMFVSLAKAESDPAYSTPDTYVTQYGPMWGYRWAKERNIKINGSLEPNPPEWVVDYEEKKRQRM